MIARGLGSTARDSGKRNREVLVLTCFSAVCQAGDGLAERVLNRTESGIPTDQPNAHLLPGPGQAKFLASQLASPVRPAKQTRPYLNEVGGLNFYEKIFDKMNSLPVQVNIRRL